MKHQQPLPQHLLMFILSAQGFCHIATEMLEQPLLVNILILSPITLPKLGSNWRSDAGVRTEAGDRLKSLDTRHTPAMSAACCPALLPPASQTLIPPCKTCTTT